jgi:hypothetical protein
MTDRVGDGSGTGTRVDFTSLSARRVGGRTRDETNATIVILFLSLPTDHHLKSDRAAAPKSRSLGRASCATPSHPSSALSQNSFAASTWR